MLVENTFFALYSACTSREQRVGFVMAVGTCEDSPPPLPPLGCGVDSNQDRMQDLSWDDIA